ncbi:hypothetical protein K6Y76_05190 [Burkholderia cenocepacia]|nr:hypothetical protein [Burkholderia cenocepacia]MCW3521208.1 hypothetical protein [Burkholderia cenocepacia]MCW3612399.1 hypothetical protein [Burkholderia cenocepacia]MCW3650237.1 hypothetical protein [Burkholderia cenocepacia]MCW3664226.1 hypothetical protein [Burkholderia cenocepacia]MCW3678976.1 hypothetical protein [Burkholderia cenocepacia]
MKAAIYSLACVGAVVMALALADVLGAGHFRLYYGLTAVECYAAGYGT